MFGRKNSIYPYLYIAPAFIVMMMLVFYPLALAFYYSVTNMNQYNMGTPYVDPSYEFVGFENYTEAFRDPQFLRVVKQTFIWTGACVIFQTLLGLMLAMLLNRPMKAKGVYRTILLIPWAVPSFISAFSWRWLYNYEYGFINLFLAEIGMTPIPWDSDPAWAMTSAIVTNIWLGVPFMMVIMLGGLQSIPSDIYEAAIVDGATRIQKFMKITLPMLKPIALPAVLLGTIWTFNMFNVIYLVTGGGPYQRTEILVTYAYKQAFENWNFGLAATYGVIILVMLALFSIIYNKISASPEEM